MQYVVKERLLVRLKNHVDDRGVVCISDPGNRIRDDIDPFSQIGEGEGRFRDCGIRDIWTQSGIKVFNQLGEEFDLIR